MSLPNVHPSHRRVVGITLLFWSFALGNLALAMLLLRSGEGIAVAPTVRWSVLALCLVVTALVILSLKQLRSMWRWPKLERSQRVGALANKSTPAFTGAGQVLAAVTALLCVGQALVFGYITLVTAALVVHSEFRRLASLNSTNLAVLVGFVLGVLCTVVLIRAFFTRVVRPENSSV